MRAILILLLALLIIPPNLHARSTTKNPYSQAVIDHIVHGAHMRTTSGEDVILASVEMPPVLANATKAERHYADQAARALAALVLKKSVQLRPIGLKSDRHGRRLVDIQIDPSQSSVRMELVSQGWAYVSPHVRPLQDVADLYVAERQARRERRGMWGSLHLTPLEHSKADRRIGRFAVIEGTVHSVRRIGSHIYVNFGADWRQDFTLIIRSPARRAFAECDPHRLAQRHVRVRGWVQSYYGALIEIHHPQQIDTTNDALVGLCRSWQTVLEDEESSSDSGISDSYSLESLPKITAQKSTAQKSTARHVTAR